GWQAAPTDDTVAYQVLADRRPKWIDEWVEMVLEENPRNCALVRRLWCEGLCQKPTHDNYLLGLLDGHSNLLGRYDRGSKWLLANPDLVVDAWRLFEIEGSGEFSLAARDKYSSAENTWETGLVELAAQGKLPRARLLDASLDALERDYAQFRASWFS